MSSKNVEDPEQRKEPRRPARIPATFKIGKQLGQGETIDLSERGVLLATSFQAHAGDYIFLRLTPDPREADIKVMGCVRRVTELDFDQLPALAVEFYTLYSEDRAHLEAFLREHFPDIEAAYHLELAGPVHHKVELPRPPQAMYPPKPPLTDTEALAKFDFGRAVQGLIARFPWRALSFVLAGVAFYLLLSFIFNWISNPK